MTGDIDIRKNYNLYYSNKLYFRKEKRSMEKQKVYDVLNETERREQLTFDNKIRLLELKVKADEQKVERMKLLVNNGVHLFTTVVAVIFCLLSVGALCFYEVHGVLPMTGITKVFVGLCGKMFSLIIK